MNISKTWTELKALLSTKYLKLQYEEMTDTPPRYFVFAEDGTVIYTCKFNKGTEEATDFETNYKATANQPIGEMDADGKPYVRAESRPLMCTTYFTSAGDSDESGISEPIGNGTRLEWDANNSGEFSSEGAPEGFKQKVIEIQFVDAIWIKEGTLYWMDAMKGSYVDMRVLCPPGLYYMYLGTLKQNTTGDWLVVDHYLNKHPIMGSVPMGDELNTEACSQELPSYLKYQMTVTVPEDDDESYGYLELELYRQRTITDD